MNKYFSRAYRLMQLFGADPVQTTRAVRRLPRFVYDLMAYQITTPPTDPFRVIPQQLYPALLDDSSEAGTASGHYFHQDLWAARLVYSARPTRHTDVGSRIDGFVAHLLTFMSVDVIDIRKLDSKVTGLTFLQEDATRLSTIADNSLPSVSSLHAVEHFGLGRYGDRIDPDGWRRGMQSLARVLAPEGRLYFSVPVGRERLRFNGHRIFAPQTVLTEFSSLRLCSFSMVDDNGDFHERVSPDAAECLDYGCGLFELSKDAPSGGRR